MIFIAAVLSVFSFAAEPEYLVATDATYPPFEFKDKRGAVEGFDKDILEAIGKNQGFTVKFISMKRSELFPSIKSGKYAIAAARLGINPERLAISEMSEPYISAPNIIMSHKNIDVKTLEGLAGLKVAAQKGSYSLQSLKDINHTPLVETDTLFSAFKQLAQGKVQAAVGDAGTLMYLSKQTPKLKFNTEIYDKKEDVRIGFAVQKGNIELINKINAGLKNIHENGQYDAIYKKWFGDDNSMKM